MRQAVLQLTSEGSRGPLTAHGDPNCRVRHRCVFELREAPLVCDCQAHAECSSQHLHLRPRRDPHSRSHSEHPAPHGWRCSIAERATVRACGRGARGVSRRLAPNRRATPGAPRAVVAFALSYRNWLSTAGVSLWGEQAMISSLRFLIAVAALAVVAVVAGPRDAVADGEPACAIFPPDNPWNTDVSGFPVHAQSDAFVDAIGRYQFLHPDFGTVWNGAPNGIPYVMVRRRSPRCPSRSTTTTRATPGRIRSRRTRRSRAGRTARRPSRDRDRPRPLQAVRDVRRAPAERRAAWTAGSGAVFDLSRNALRPDGWTSRGRGGAADLPGPRALRRGRRAGRDQPRAAVHVQTTRRAYCTRRRTSPSQTDRRLPPMGLRVRLKAVYDCSAFRAEVRVILPRSRSTGCSSPTTAATGT